MTGRERLLAVLSGKMPDRVPISTYELVGYNSAAFENRDPSYARLMQAIREKTDCICMWDPDSNSAIPKRDHIGDFLETTSFPVEIETLERRDGNRAILKRTVHAPEGVLTSTAEVSDNVHTVWKTEHWCKSPDDVDKLLAIPYEPVDYDFADRGRVSTEVGNHGIIMSSVFDPLGWALDLMRFEDGLVWAFTEPEHFDRTLHRIHERVIENLKRMLSAGVVDLYRICGSEVATPPYMHRTCFERWVVPFVSEIVELIHRKGAMARVHCHGKIGTVLDLIAATDADGLDPCEGLPDGDVVLSEVKKRVGDRMCIFGNIQLKLLDRGTRNEIHETVKGCMAAAKSGGRYVLMPTAAPIDSPLPQKTEDNYLHYIDAALEYGTY